MLFKEHHIDNYIEYISYLPPNKIPGLIRYEKIQDKFYFPDWHAHYDWDYNNIEEYGGKKFAHFTNLHQATFILTREQLDNIGKIYDFTNFFKGRHHSRYSCKCLVNTEIYEYCNMKKLICISDLKGKFYSSFT